MKASINNTYILSGTQKCIDAYFDCEYIYVANQIRLNRAKITEVRPSEDITEALEELTNYEVSTEIDYYNVNRLIN